MPVDKSIYSREYTLFLELLRTIRLEAGITQEQVAARLGKKQTFVSKCERGERRLDIVELRSWSRALNMPFRDLVERFDKSCTTLLNDVLSGDSTSHTAFD